MRQRLILPLYALILLIAAGLLFNIQPMIGKMLLPKVGGSPAVWNVAMACFQIMLLAGYIMAHGLSRLAPLWHGLVYFLLIAMAALTLPFALPETLGDISQSPMFLTAKAVITTVGISFVALSLTAPTLQRLFTTTGHKDAQDPYFLYVASNIGSFIGLLAYPLLIEPNLGLSVQTQMWRYGFWLLVMLVPLSLIGMKAKAEVVIPEEQATASTSWKQRLEWIFLALIPSSLTLGVTTYVSTDISPTPMLWVGTLALYLLTFIIAFAQRGEKLRQINMNLFPFLAMIATVILLSKHLAGPMAMTLHLIAFFSISLACHTRLALLRPNAKQLTEFYLCLSVGGAIGGSFNAFIAPLLFNDLYEYPIILLSALFFVGRHVPLQLNQKVFSSIMSVLVVFMIAALATGRIKPELSGPTINMVMIALGIAITLYRSKPLISNIATVALLIAIVSSHFVNPPIYQGRDFFGVIAVKDMTEKTMNRIVRVMNHGSTVHGLQIVKPQLLTVPTGYYSPRNPIGMIWNTYNPQDVAVIGLGTGALNCYAHPDHPIHYVEIDPLVIEISRKYFTFTTACPQPEVTLGDGRLVMAEDTRLYDLIVLDAFSSDAIPMHLLTREAIEIYLKRLKPDGLLAFHVSNRFFDLEPVLAAAAQDLGLTAMRGRNIAQNNIADTIAFPSIWIVMAKDAQKLSPLSLQAVTWRNAMVKPNISAWRDDYSSLVHVMNTPLP